MLSINYSTKKRQSLNKDSICEEMFEAAAASDAETVNDEISQLFDEDNGLSETGRMIRFQFRKSFSFFLQF